MMRIENEKISNYQVSEYHLSTMNLPACMVESLAFCTRSSSMNSVTHDGPV